MCGTHHTTTFLFIKYWVKMWCIVLGIPDALSISYTISWLSSLSNVDTITIKVLSITLVGQPVQALSPGNRLLS